MRTTTLRTSLLALAAIAVALLVVAVAVAQPGDGDSGVAEEPTPIEPAAAPTSSPTEEPTIQPDAEPTEAPGSAAPTERIDTPLPTAADNPGPSDGEGTGAEGENPSVGITVATNPGGHCVELPNDSDIVEDPDKHPGWTVGSCNPTRSPGPPDLLPPDNNGGGPPEGRTPSLNPEGVCVNLPNNSDIVRNPEKHPGWVVGGCALPAE